MKDANANSYSNAISLKTSSRLTGVSDWIESLTSALIFVIIVFSCIFRVVMVDGDSMNPTLINKDYLIISSLFANPENDDIVVVLTEGNDGHPIIKRVIGTSNETVSIDYVNNTVTVTDALGNASVLSEPYILDQDMRLRGDISFTADWDNAPEIVHDQTTGEIKTVTYKVPEGKYFVLGDNRNNSKDSRYNEIGIVSRSQILGEVSLRVSPFDQFGTVK